MKFQKIFLFALSFLPILLVAQSEIPIGSWNSYLPYNSGIAVTQSDEKIIYATEWSIMTIDKSDFSIEKVSSIEGLTEVGIQNIEYDQNNEQLVIAYDNSIIDIVNGDEVIPVFGIKDNSAISGNKKIYDIYIDDDSFAYFATGFGVVQFDLINYEFGFSAKPLFQFNAITRFQNFLIAASVDGVYTFDISSQNIPDDFGNWNLLEAPNGLPTVYNALDVELINDQLYVVADDEIYKAGADLNFELVYTNNEAGFNIQFVTPEKEGWILGLRSENQKSKLQFFDTSDNPTQENKQCSDRLLDAIQDQDGRIWLADNFNLFRYLQTPSSDCNTIFVNSPNSQEASELAIKDDVLYVASGGVSDAFAYLFSKAGYYFFEDGNWTNINQGNNSQITDNNMQNMYTIAPHPSENKVYIGSFYGGILEHNLEDNTFQSFNGLSGISSLGVAVGDEQRTRISALKFDDDNNLWIANHAADKPLSVLTDGGVWHSFDVNSDTKLTQITFDDAGRIWAIVNGNSGGVLVYDHKGTIADPSDDEQRFIGSNGSNIPSGLVNCIETDLDGDIWVGTAEGPVIFNCGGNFLDPELCAGNLEIVTQDSIAAILLQTENIRTIAIDGANRKWFGTKNGVFVQSADAKTQIFHFTEENSPLFDNSINDIAYNEDSGEMFIATDKGIISYRTGATGAREFAHSSNVYAYPNPVREDYFGPIAIKGLVRNANVKITDINGKLVFETTALGGQAIWDGKDYTGRNATSGVYMVFSSTTDTFNDPNSFVTKILVVR